MTFPTAPNGWFIMTMHQRHRDAGCYGNEDMRPVSKSFVVAFVKYPKGNHMQMAQAETMDEAWRLAVGMTEAFDAVHKPGGTEQPKSPDRWGGFRPAYPPWTKPPRLA